MKKILSLICLAGMLSACHGAGAVYRPIASDLNSPRAQKVLNPKIQLHFAEGPVQIDPAHTFVSNKKTNAHNKNAEQACQIAFLSALISLQQRAVVEGGNAVVNIHSYYKKNPYFSAETYYCEDGYLMSGVALRGTVVRQ